MNKKELVDSIAQKTGLKKNEAEKSLDALCVSIIESIKKGSEVSLPHIGKFTISEMKARKGRNPHTGEELMIKARMAVNFRSATALKEAAASIPVKSSKKGKKK